MFGSDVFILFGFDFFDCSLIFLFFCDFNY